MIPVEILPAAEADLDDIANHLNIHSTFAFIKLISALQRRFRVLSQHPAAGKVCDGFGHDLRVIFVGRYGVYYRQIDERIDIVRILDGRRDQKANFNDEA